jgi:RimJ/RimL family protein N-acetyltransferase
MLTGARLTLRPIAPGDAAAMAALLEHDAEATAMTARIPVPCTEADALAWIQVASGPPAYTFAILRHEDGAFLGAAGFALLGELAGLGYWLGRRYWGQGYATEAAALAVAHARQLGATRLEAETFPENQASARVLQKLGFRTIGEVVRDLPRRGGARRLLQWQAP